MTQLNKVRAYLKRHRTITPREALMDLGVYRLSDVIFKLRNAGMNIVTDLKQNPDTGAKYGTYRLVRA
jgi:hypothetical protein